MGCGCGSETFEKSSPDAVYQPAPITVPFGMDLPFLVQLAQCCSPFDPYNLAEHEIIGEIFDSPDLEVLLLTFDDESWERDQSEDQDEPVDDILHRIFKWEELDELERGEAYWFVLRAIDSNETRFPILAAPFIKS